MTWVSGVDGCRAGWLIIDSRWENARPVEWRARIAANLDEVLDSGPGARTVGLDMPVGFLDEHCPGGRLCDRETRRVLGRRGCCVFSPPIRPLLGATHYDSVRKRGVTIQAFHILPKMREVDDWIDPEKQKIVFEGHPELAFCRLAGRPMANSKKRRAGRNERLEALSRIFPNIGEWVQINRFPRKQVAVDDILDALVLAWVAHRKWKGVAEPLPLIPPRDKHGLEMAIWA